ncbi:hypothetical protein BaRGS_00002538 [Batillaria attramentaria]|uniref:Uncharacterized protein n=1 Tax=Batillaria attramentaria TaxID=370345 RepID=A0ABD0M3R7_9CAEN
MGGGNTDFQLLPPLVIRGRLGLTICPVLVGSEVSSSPVNPTGIIGANTPSAKSLQVTESESPETGLSTRFSRGRGRTGQGKCYRPTAPEVWNFKLGHWYRTEPYGPANLSYMYHSSQLNGTGSGELLKRRQNSPSGGRA